MFKSRCILILSEKSSGSSALQAALTQSGQARCVAHTRHFEQETLYWTKAASILDLPQVKMVDSEVPIPAGRARAELIQLIVENTGIAASSLPEDSETLVFEGWRLLCEAHDPAFVEKSPHHLCQSSALDLIIQARQRLPDIGFVAIGLVRNPLAVICSQYTRWGSPTAAVEKQWCQAYENLWQLQTIHPDLVQTVRYEDLANDPEVLSHLLDRMGIPGAASPNALFHSGSVDKWRRDPRFGHQLQPETVELAARFGYAPDALQNSHKPSWNLHRLIHRARWWARRARRRAAKLVRRGG